MPNLTTVKIDVRKLDKARFVEGKPDANGHRPLYCDLVLVPRREVGRYGDTHLVKQSKRKEEPIEMPILGSATERGQPAPAQQPPQTRPAAAQSAADMADDVPF